MKLTKQKLKEIIKEELLNESVKLMEATALDKAYDEWHNASTILLKTIRKDSKDANLARTFNKAWDLADRALIKWFDKQGY